MLGPDITPRTYAPRGCHRRSTTRSCVGALADRDESVTKHSVVQPTKVAADPMIDDDANFNPNHRQSVRLSTCQLSDPACTTAFLKKHYHPLKWCLPVAPLLGMENFIRAEKEIHELFANQSAIWNLAPNSETNTLKASKSTSHGGFDDNKATVKGTLARIIGSSGTGDSPFEFTASASSSKDRRRNLRQSLS